MKQILFNVDDELKRKAKRVLQKTDISMSAYLRNSLWKLVREDFKTACEELKGNTL